MKVIVADDNPMDRKLLEHALSKRGYQTIEFSSGENALPFILENEVRLGVIDWMMPGMSGIELCREIRKADRKKYFYILLVTARDQKEDIVEGLSAGADDYLPKPFDPGELIARIQVGERILGLEERLRNKIVELEEMQNTVDQLETLIPICSDCKKIRNDQNYWEKIENFISEHSDWKFTHSLCPECRKKYF